MRRVRSILSACLLVILGAPACADDEGFVGGEMIETIVIRDEDDLRQRICEQIGMSQPCTQAEVTDFFGFLLENDPSIIYLWCEYRGTFIENQTLFDLLAENHLLIIDGIGVEEVKELIVPSEYVKRFERNVATDCVVHRLEA